eukprot:COSAG02_NODE_894_length_16133_cov_5.336036_6_plen_93_part_00
MQQPWLCKFAQQAHEIALEHAEQHDPALAATLRRAMDVIPLELRVCGIGVAAGEGRAGRGRVGAGRLRPPRDSVFKNGVAWGTPLSASRAGD